MRYPACFGTMKVRPPAAMCYTNECKAAGYCYDFGSLLDALIESKKKNFNEEEFNEFRLSIVDAMNT